MKGQVIAAALAGSLATLLAGCGSSPSSAKPTEVGATTAAALTVTSVTPAVIPVGTAATLTVYGTGFQSETAVLINSATVATTYVSGTQLTATVTSTQFPAGAVVPVSASDHGVLAGAQGTLEIDNPKPVLSLTSPVSAVAGSGSVAVTMTGSGFSAATTGMFNGAARPTVYTSPTQISVTLTAADDATAGSFPMTVVNAGPGGGSSSASGFLVMNPVPSIASLLPAALSAGASGAVVTVQGTGFLAGSTVLVNGAARTTSVASGTQLSFAATAADLSTGTTLQVAVQNPAPGGGISAALALPVNNPTPSIVALSPSTIAFGTAAPTTVTVTGTNLAAGATVSVAGVPRAATVLSGTSLTFAVSTAEQAVAGAVPIVVTNPPPGGGASAPASLTITNTVPSAGALSPSSIPVGTASATTVTLGGAGFAPGATVAVNGVSRPATLVSSAKLSFSVSSAEVATVGTLPVVVTNPAPGGGSSATVNLAVTGLVPTIGTITPSPVFAGSSSPTSITVAGSNFAASATVSVNGVARAASVSSASSLTFPLTAAETAAAGTLSIVVTNPNPGGGVSAPAQLAINNPQPGALTLSPSTVVVGTAAPVNVTISGSNFVGASSVSVAGVTRTATILNSTTAVFALTASDLSTAGTLPVVVTSAGGGSSPAATLTVANPVPGAITLSPATVVAGTAGPVAVTVSGTNFVPGSTVLVGGAARSTTYSSSTKLSFTLASGDLATAGTLSVVVTNAGPGGGSSPAATFTVSNPQPGQIAVTPGTIVAGGSTPVTVTVTGSNFVAASSVLVNGKSRSASVASATSLTFVLSTADIATPGTVSVAVSNPSPGGGVTSTATIILSNPVPGVASVSPSSVTVGAAPALLTLSGSNFEPGAQVLVNGSARATTVVSVSQITAQLVAADQASAGTITVSVANPTPGGGTSNAVQVPVVNPAPGAITLSPGSTTVGGTAPLPVTVAGSGFVRATVANVNGSARTTTFVSSTQLTMQLTVADQATAGDLAVTVSTAAPGGGTSASVAFHVQDPVPVINSVSPNAVTAGTSTTTAVTVTGSHFVAGATVSVNGVAHATTFTSASSLGFSLSVAEQASAGVLSVSVTNPAPGGGASDTAAITVNNPAPGSAISVSPSSVPVGTTTATTVTVNGTGFVRGAVVTVAGSARSTTYVSATQLTFALTAADQSTATTLTVLAANPTPGGGSTGSATIAITNPQPGPITLSPSTLPVSSSGATSTVTVTGSNFIAGSSVTINGAGRATTYKSATQLTFTTVAADQATASTLSVAVTNAAPGGGTTPSVSLTVTDPLPVLTGASPATVAAGGAAGTIITLAGSGFVSTSSVQVNGASRTATFVSPTQLTLALTAADQASPGTLSIVVVNPAPGGGTSSAASVSVAYLQPTVATLSPASVPVGGATPTQITVTGTNYLSGSTVQVNGSNRATTYISATSLTFVLTVADQSSAAQLSITVTNPSPSNRVSAAATLLVGQRTSTPTISSISPGSAFTGASAFALTVSGTNFGSTSTVQWNGSALSTAVSGTSGTTLVAQVPANLLTAAGTAAVTVVNPTATPTTSNAATFTIFNPPAPVVTSVSPSYGAINTAANLTVAGTGFQPNTTLSLNGSALTTTFVSSTTLTVAIPASTLALPGNYAFSAVTPSPGGGTSATVYFTAYIPVVSNSMVYDSANGLFYLSIPGSAGTPLGNSVVSVDPATGTLGTPIYVGSEPNKLAITADGTGLWVGLDGASAVRRVDLSAGTAGMQFQLALNPSTGYVDQPPVALSLLALPGAANSVVVQASAGSPQFAIYDSGVLRSSNGPAQYNGPQNYTPRALALQANNSTGEIYSGGTGLNTYTSNSSGLSFLATNSTPTLATTVSPEMQLNSGMLYTDLGFVYNAETGAQAGSLAMSGNVPAVGPTFADAGTNRIFVLDQPSSNPYAALTRLQVFSLTDNSLQALVVPLNMPAFYTSTGSGTIVFPQGVNGLSRWGANGLAVRSPVGVFSVQSNSVADLSALQSDLAISASSIPSAATGVTVPVNFLITNHGAAAAGGVALQISAPSLGSVSSVSTTVGTCSSGSPVLCSLGTMANGATAVVTVNVLETDAGTSTIDATVSSANADPLPINNSVETSVQVTGSHYSVTPTVGTLSPSSIQAGAASTTITVSGSGFTSGSTVTWNGANLATTYMSATQLTAVVPASSLATLGWGAIAVSSPAPGGGVSNAVSLSVYTVTPVLANSMVYEPYSRRIFVSVNTNSKTIAGDSVVALQPETGVLATPVHVGSQPVRMAVSGDGLELYTLLTGTAGLSRINLLTGQVDLSVAFPASGVTPQDIAVLPNSDTAVAIDGGASSGISLYDINQSAGTATPRTALPSTYVGTCLNFYSASTLYSVDTVSNGGALYSTAVSSGGLTTGYTSGSTLNNLGCIKIDGGLVFGRGGAVADPSTSPATPLGVFQGAGTDSSSTPRAFAADRELGRVFFPVSTGANNSATVDGVAAYNVSTFQLSGTVSLGVAAAKVAPYDGEMEMLRWGQDGLALLSSDGHLYLLRGGFVVPQLMTSSDAALFSGRSSPALTHGDGNTLLTIGGSNFLPGVAVTWNGSYRTTTLVDSSHITVAVPASDLTKAGVVSLVATNPGAMDSGTLDIIIQ